MMLGLPADIVERIGHGALLHDVGKLAIPNEILDKDGASTPAEWAVIAEHPLIGERILRRTPQLAGLAPDRAPRARALGRQRLPGRPRGPPDPARLAHHPRLRRLRRDDHRAPLPPGADARRRRSPSCAPRPGTQFDPEVVDALLDLPRRAERAGQLGASPASAGGVGVRDQRRGVGQPRRAVEAAVLHVVAERLCAVWVRVSSQLALRRGCARHERVVAERRRPAPAPRSAPSAP